MVRQHVLIRTCLEKMSKKSVLILGAGLMQGPAIRAARNLGYRTVAADANPDAACAKEADAFENVDLKDRDGLAALADRINGGKERSLAAVFTAGTDFSANAAYIAERLSLAGHRYEACLNASDKVRMRKCFAASGVPSPAFEEIGSESLDELIARAERGEVTFPKVIKPVDNMGGRGCRMVRDSDELKASAAQAIRYSRTSRAVFEDYMEGAEYSIDALVYKGTLTITGFADRHIYYPPYFIETGHTMPSRADKKTKLELFAAFALGVKALGLDCGVAKADIKYTDRGPMIGEIAARLSGGYMSGWTFPLASGCNLTQEALKIALGEEPDYVIERRTPLDWRPHRLQESSAQPFELYELDCGRVSAERAWISIPGKVARVTGLDKAFGSEGIEEVFPRIKDGDKVDFPRNNVEKCGNVISCAQTREQAVKDAYSALGGITVELESGNPATDNFIAGLECPDERGFPPAAFSIDVDFDNVRNIPAGKSIADFVPPEIEAVKNTARDWNHCTFANVIERFDRIFPGHGELDGKTFWKAALRGSIQAMLYVAKKN